MLRSHTRPTEGIVDNTTLHWPGWVTGILLALSIVALASAALPTLLYPLTRDQGAYAYQADIMMQGGALFRDAWESKGPGVQFAYVFAFLLFGRSEFAVRVFDALYALLSAASVYVLAHEAFRSRGIAACSAWLYALAYYLLVHFHSMGTSEAFMTPFLVASTYSIVRGLRSRTSYPLLLAGIAGGFVFWFKPTAGLVILVMLVWSWLRMWRDHWSLREVFCSQAIVILGALLGLLPFGLYLYGRGLKELLEIWRVYGTGAYLAARGMALGDGPLAMLDVIMGYLRDWQLLLWLSLAGAAVAVAGRRRNRAGEAIVIFLLSSVVSTVLQRKLFEYHWVPILAPAAILSAVTMVRLARETRQQARNLPFDMRSIFVVVVVVGLLVWIAYDNLARYRRTAAYLAGRLSDEQYYAQFDIGRDFSHLGTLDAATYLREHTEPGETVLVWGMEALVNFLAQRRSPTRYIYSSVLVGDSGNNPGLEAWRQDFLDDLRSAPPRYIVLIENDITPLSPQGSLVQMDEIPAFKALLHSEYDLEAQLEDYLFYRRRES